MRVPYKMNGSWPSGPLTSPVCPYCGRKEEPEVVEGQGTEQIVYHCPGCGRRWTVRHQPPEDSGIESTRRH